MFRLRRIRWREQPQCPPRAYPHHGERKFGQRIRKHQTGNGGTLTDLIFTPASNTLFSDFSFRGQLRAPGWDGDPHCNG